MKPLTKEQSDELKSRLDKEVEEYTCCPGTIKRAKVIVSEMTEKTAPPWYEGMTSTEIRKLARGLSQGVPDGQYINWSDSPQGKGYWQGVYNNLISLARELEEYGK